MITSHRFYILLHIQKYRLKGCKLIENRKLKCSFSPFRNNSHLSILKYLRKEVAKAFLPLPPRRGQDSPPRRGQNGPPGGSRIVPPFPGGAETVPPRRVQNSPLSRRGPNSPAQEGPNRSLQEAPKLSPSPRRAQTVAPPNTSVYLKVGV